MEKFIIKISYWLGMIFVSISFVLRGLNILGMASFGTRGSLVGYNSFLDGATILFLTSIATASYAWFK